MKKVSVALFMCRRRMARYDQLLQYAEELWQRERSRKKGAMA